jgi:hypothetical protein
MALPGTTPPPQTRSNSSTPVAMRGGAGLSLCRPSKARPRVLVALLAVIEPGARAVTSSTMLFQALQAGHWPAHLDCAAPQDWQT